MSQPVKSLTLEQCRDGWRKYACGEATAKLMQGWFLLQAQQHHAIPHAVKSAAGGRSQAITNVGNGSEGFVLWLTESASVGQATAYNYITAAQRAGLTVQMTEKEALEAADSYISAMAAQAGWKFSDLYKKKEEEETEQPEKKKGIAAKLEQMVFAWDELLNQTRALNHSATFIEALPLLDDNKLEELEAEARHTLDAVREARAKKASTKPKRGGAK